LPGGAGGDRGREPARHRYDGDALSQRLDRAFSDLFEREVAALWIATGTAANSLALAELCPPHGP
jgi:threonine aldolase